MIVERQAERTNFVLSESNIDILSHSIAAERAFNESLMIADELKGFDPRFNTELIKTVVTAIHERDTKGKEIPYSVCTIVEHLEREAVDKNSIPLFRAVRFTQAAGRIRTNDYYLRAHLGDREPALQQLENDWTQDLELLRDVPGELKSNFAQDYQAQRLSLRERKPLSPYKAYSLR